MTDLFRRGSYSLGYDGYNYISLVTKGNRGDKPFPVYQRVLFCLVTMVTIQCIFLVTKGNNGDSHFHDIQLGDLFFIWLHR